MADDDSVEFPGWFNEPGPRSRTESSDGPWYADPERVRELTRYRLAHDRAADRWESDDPAHAAELRGMAADRAHTLRKMSYLRSLDRRGASEESGVADNNLGPSRTGRPSLGGGLG